MRFKFDAAMIAACLVILHIPRNIGNFQRRVCIAAGFMGFQPKKKGTYVVDVIQDGAKFPGSPFQIQIGDTEVCCATRVKVTGAVREGMTQQWNDVVIDVAEAGKRISPSRCQCYQGASQGQNIWSGQAWSARSASQ